MKRAGKIAKPKVTVLDGIIYQVSFVKQEAKFGDGPFYRATASGADSNDVYVLGKDFRDALSKIELAFPNRPVGQLSRIGSWCSSGSKINPDRLVI